MRTVRQHRHTDRIIFNTGASVSEGAHYDANNDGTADITDVACVINYILNH